MNDWFSIVQSKFKIGHFIPPIHVSARRGWDVNNQSKNFTLSFVARFAKEIRHMKEIIWKLITPPAVLCDGHAHKFLIVEKKSQIQKCTTRSLLLVKRCQLIRRTRTAQYVSRPLNAMAYRIHILLYQSKRYISVDKWIIRRSGTIATRVGKKKQSHRGTTWSSLRAKIQCPAAAKRARPFKSRLYLLSLGERPQ